MYWIMNFITPGNQSAPAPSYRSDAAEPARNDYNSPRIESLNSLKPKTQKNIRDIKSLENWDMIVDHEGNTRFVIWRHNWKVLMTWKNVHIDDYKKVYTWSGDKFLNAIDSKGFRLIR